MTNCVAPDDYKPSVTVHHEQSHLDGTVHDEPSQMVHKYVVVSELKGLNMIFKSCFFLLFCILMQDPQAKQYKRSKEIQSKTKSERKQNMVITGIQHRICKILSYMYFNEC